MIGVTFGIGELWQRVAFRTARRMERLTGLKCVVVSDVPEYSVSHPSWLKCFIPEMFPDEDAFFCFDADTFPVRPFDPINLWTTFNFGFLGVVERPNVLVSLECSNFGLDATRYINGGVTIFGARHSFVWEYVWNKHPAHGSWMEQTALNEALQKLNVDLCTLSQKYNQFIPVNPASYYTGPEMLDQSTDYIWHAAGSGSNAERIEQIQRILYRDEDFNIPL